MKSNKNRKQALDPKNENRGSTPIPFPEEVEHLKNMLVFIGDELQESINRVERHDKEYNEFKRYMAEYRHEIDPKELFQNELFLKNIEIPGVIATKERERLRKLLDSPYFSRIDFRIDGDSETAVYYIGRFTFGKKDQIHIFDWRAPIASMFYDVEVGRAGYDAPIGRIDGELTRKRQFKIRNGEMEYVLESSTNIQDDVLQRELSSTSDEKMKSIIATLQREQNQIIRNEQAGTMVIQGVAGSGKTSIALHRIAYLLYRFKDTLSAENIVVLSPNKVFGDYISSVLPELGEEPILEMSFVDVAKDQLDGVISFELDKDSLETNDLSWAERVRFKSTLDFIIMLDDYMDDVEDAIFAPSDYMYGGFTATSAWIWKRYKAYKRYSIKRRLEEIANDIHNKFVAENIYNEKLPGERTILKGLTSMLTVKNTLALYKGFFRHINKPDYFVMPEKKTLEWADVYPFMYLHSSFVGMKENKNIKHLVIDEMQDYTPIQYEVMNLLFKCNKTILGDFGQAINPNNLHSLDFMRDIYVEGKIVELNKSYRSSYEIINFAKRVLSVSKLEPVERHGEEPSLIKCQTKQEEMEQIKVHIDAFLQSHNVTMGIITKTNTDAKILYDVLCQKYNVHLLTPDSDKFTSGITITSIQMSKGLEFDEVIITSVNQATYYNEYDRGLLYIACTRAMHRLTLIYDGELTKLIK
ncbi:HelD family protein [Bacillus massiliigorillae]|uniref:HelD family protein n=1 Tax=Bacillus massiliigorillae TaxID=1243664 RepID=UPI0003A870CF|nr:3'-5' exonuclease [Bacillus massiliigorillae]